MKRKVFTTLLGLLLCFSTITSSANAIEYHNYQMNAETVQKKVQTSHEKQLQEIYQKNDIDSSLPNFKREIIVDNIDNIKCIEESYTRPIVIYEENITYRLNKASIITSDVLNTTNATYTDQDVNIRQYIYYGITISITTGISVDCVNTVDTLTEPMKVNKIWSNWITDDQIQNSTDTGGGVNTISCSVQQSGPLYNGGSTHPISDYFSVNQDETSTGSYYNKYYTSNPYYNLIPESSAQAGGAVYYFATYDIYFQYTTVPYMPPDVYHMTLDRTVGFGALPV